MKQLRHSPVAFTVLLSCLFALTPLPAGADSEEQTEYRVATFSADVTMPLNHRCMGVLPTKSRKVIDPLEAIGFVLLGAERPIVVVAIDWCEIRNGAYDQWREALADAASTTRERVLVTSLHQHDAPVTDAGAAAILREAGLPGELYDEQFQEDAIRRTAAALTASLSHTVPITHLGTGQARVKQIASNRRIVGADGRVSFSRGSRSGADPDLSAAPEGQIDPFLKTISFWNGDTPVTALSVYATHPMSYYGQGEISADFVGLARRRRQLDLPHVTQIYASGCSGDVTAGKYNDGSEQSREQLTQRLYDGMKAAWESTTKTPINTVRFRSAKVKFEFYSHANLEPEKLQTTVADSKRRTEDRILAAMGLSSHRRVTAGQPIDFPCVDFGTAQLLLFPGESFVGYQLMAQQMKPESFVVSMGYGECWPGYIPLNSSFGDGFHDVWLWVPPGSENKLQRALQTVLTP
ncbi:MAG: hypothetical protein RIK87_01335 [Fuerstiella sp.]